MSLLAYYRRQLARGEMEHDPAQEGAVLALHEISQNLNRRPRWWQRPFGRPAPVRGLYLWGGVGRGKTKLMDMFFNSTDTRKKKRVHFHRFMHDVHRRMRGITGRKNPLQIAAGELAGDCRVLCLDEFFVIDIGDAMILAGLLRELFARGVCLVATSNTPPRKLYENGLQRSRFLPAISLLETHCREWPLEGDRDYRLAVLEDTEFYHFPDGGGARKKMDEAFAALRPGESRREKRVRIEGREIKAVQVAGDVGWFAFSELCETARSQGDYLALAIEFHTLLLSGVPIMDDKDNDAARRFVYLIDILYDHQVKLIVSAAAPPDGLYMGKRLAADFARARSRLAEMRTRAYLESGHRN